MILRRKQFALIGFGFWSAVSVIFTPVFLFPRILQSERITPMLLLHNLEVQKFSGEIIKVNFVNVDIRSVFKSFEKAAGFEFDIEPAVSGKVSYRFGEIPWDEALDRILKDRKLLIDLGFSGVKIHTGYAQSLIITDSSKIKLLVFVRRFLFLILAGLVLLLGGLTLLILQRRKSVAGPFGNQRNSKGTPRRRLMDDKKAEEIKERILELLEKDNLHRSSDLSLQSLASELNITIHQLSWVINKKFGQTFANLINHYRVEEVKRRLLDNDRNSLSILEIALESGFNTKTAFNRVFKKHTGVTPSEYKKNSNRL